MNKNSIFLVASTLSIIAMIMSFSSALAKDRERIVQNSESIRKCEDKIVEIIKILIEEKSKSKSISLLPFQSLP